MKTATLLLAAVTATGLAAGAQAQDAMGGESPGALAMLKDTNGATVGMAELYETAEGVLIRVEADGIPEGWHGFHLHETGDCSAADFTSAGGHYAPEGKAHGLLSGEAPHAGDLPNVYATADGHVAADMASTALTLQGGEAPILDSDGSAFIIHEGPDSYGDEAGAGARIACGIVEAAS
ncbi:superoxide dismutase family protein [Salipiger bermudensis]|uniref:superoxide dismutase family protein n=1 Tax=Salipiger bermudensis TaxID=344736 RepID=UPI001C993050|nr:superoxide dismutase family protein [Salipiger bermudensis]MBY6002763.1 superoxide dismutase family protein [Salipiger bermudensis]